MKVTVVPGSDVDRERFDARCRGWGAEVGVEVLLPGDPPDPDASVVDPDSFPRERGVTGYRWAIRHLAFAAAWPPEVVTYGTRPDQAADVRVPDGAGATAVLLHGGFWRPAWDRDLMDGLAVDLARRGWRTVNLGYRRERWPAPGEDVVTGIARIAGDAAVLVGHSAGAQLALWAVGQGYPARMVVCLAGVCDLAAALRDGLGDGAVADLMGHIPVTDADPVSRLPLRVPQLLAHTFGDALVPVDQPRRYFRAAAAAGDVINVVMFSEGDHFTLLRPEATPWQTVAAHLAAVSERVAGCPSDR